MAKITFDEGAAAATPAADKVVLYAKTDGLVYSKDDEGTETALGDSTGATIHAADGKTTPVDADTMPLIDSEASNVLKKVTWANIKATLKTYCDSLYSVAGAIFGSTGSTDNAVIVADGTGGKTAQGTNITVSEDGNDLAVPGSVSTGTINLTGGQIAFPASQLASAGANTLDDYEEGSWTPTIAFGGASVGVTYSAHSGLYTKIGNLVTVTGMIVLTSKGSSVGNATITSLPFTCANDTGAYAGVNISYVSVIAFADFINAYVAINDAKIVLQETTNAGNLSNITNADFSDTASMVFSVTYRVA